MKPRAFLLFSQARSWRALQRAPLRYAVRWLVRTAGWRKIIVTTHWRSIVERFVDDVVVLDVRGGPISFSQDPPHLANAIQQVVQRGLPKILLNLHEVHYIDSSGLSEIIEGFKTSHTAGGVLKLCEVVPGIRRLLDVTRLDRVIEVFESEDAALRSFAAQV